MEWGLLANFHLAALIAAVAAIAAALVKGGPRQPAPLESIGAPFADVDLSDLPPLQRYSARDGATLAYRVYEPKVLPCSQRVVLIHGSSANGESLHSVARALAQAGYAAYVPDIRGHGESGRRGTIAYIGQLEDDLEDMVAALKIDAPRTLLGFSSGGGFALRVAGSNRQRLFDRYVLLAPFLHPKAPTARPSIGGWTAIGLPRIVVLVILNRLGIKLFNHLPTIAFALSPDAQRRLTPSYSFSLMQNFRPIEDYRAGLRAAKQPMEVFVGENDELFIADEFEKAFAQAGRPVPVIRVPNVSHIGLTLEAHAIDTVVARLKQLDARSSANNEALAGGVGDAEQPEH